MKVNLKLYQIVLAICNINFAVYVRYCLRNIPSWVLEKLLTLDFLNFMFNHANIIETPSPLTTSGKVES